MKETGIIMSGNHPKLILDGIKTQTRREEISCPFCGDNDFDRVGLKYHLQHYCQQYADLEELPNLIGQ